MSVGSETDTLIFTSYFVSDVIVNFLIVWVKSKMHLNGTEIYDHEPNINNVFGKANTLRRKVIADGEK